VPNRHHPHSLTQPDKVSSENKVQNSGAFFRRKNHATKAPRLPATHHNFTTKNHTKNTTFPQNPLQKRPPTTQKKIRPGKKPNRISTLQINSPYTPA
jgi:hypothetical protein